MIYHLPITPERIIRRTLANGAVVVMCENHASASVAITGQLRAGTQLERAGQEGLANLTAMLLRHGSRRHSFMEMNELLDSVGASLNTNADELFAYFNGHALSQDLPLLLDLLAEVCLQPAFDALEFEKIRGQVLTSLSIYQNDTGYRASRAFDEALYPPGHPYARPVYGTMESIAALTNDDIRAFYQEHYNPANLVLVVVGAIQPEQVMRQLDALFSGWPSSGEPGAVSVPAAPRPQTIVKVCVPLPEKSQVDLYWGTLGPSRTSPDYYAARMADLVLGRLGLMGRLGNRIRDELGLAYYVSSHLESGQGPVAWRIGAGVRASDVARTVEEIRSEVGHLRQTLITDEELADCRSYLVGSMPLGLETNSDIAEQILAIEEYGLGYDYLQRYTDIVNQVTAEDIHRVTNTYLDPDAYVLAMSGTFQ